MYCTLAADGIMTSIADRARILMKDERQDTSDLCHGEEEHLTGALQEEI